MLQYVAPSEHFRRPSYTLSPNPRPILDLPHTTAAPRDTSDPIVKSEPGHRQSILDQCAKDLAFESSLSQIPALDALASLAASACKADPVDARRSSTPISMSQPQYAPAATAGGQQNGPPVCHNCTTSTTPLWRRDEQGLVLCNACGLFLKLHGRSRPISLKTDVIKSRNRVKTPQIRRTGIETTPGLGSGTIINGPDLSRTTLQQQAQQAVAQDSTTRNDNGSIAPQHLFSSINAPADSSLRQPSPTSTSLNGSAEPSTYEALLASNSSLRIRVSELEVINDLFRGRVGELEQAEQVARQAEAQKDAEVQRLKAELDARDSELKRLREEHYDEESRPKRARTDS